ncbi:hypothetical protein [Rhizobium leguminosarum]|uniref:hypothetical protein n=1 Tax=Rhizobium leguminosarum TaxID=384 RepID=UPI002E11DBB3|nr:hypothetical protein U8Q02_41150 [Rhizobium leguminosarum]
MSVTSEVHYPLLFEVEILGVHAVNLAPAYRNDHDPAWWYGADTAGWPEPDRGIGSMCADVVEARDVARRLIAELGIPREHIRIRRIEQSLVDLDDDAETPAWKTAVAAHAEWTQEEQLPSWVARPAADYLRMHVEEAGALLSQVEGMPFLRYVASHLLHAALCGDFAGSLHHQNALLSAGVLAMANELEAPRRMFYWRSEALRRYAAGHVYVVARSVDEARRLALEEYDRHLRSDGAGYSFFRSDGTFFDDLEREQYAKAVKTFWADLEKEPKVVAASVLRGSE